MAESLLVVLIIFVLAKAHYDNQFKAQIRATFHAHRRELDALAELAERLDALDHQGKLPKEEKESLKDALKKGDIKALFREPSEKGETLE